MEDPTPPKRRWWRRLPVRLSLRGLMILVLAIGGGLGWVAHRAHLQRDAVAAIRAAGGRVVYDWGWADGHPAPSGTTTRWPRWIVDALGPDYFDSVSAVYLGRDTPDDPVMAHVGRLSRLEYLSLNSCRRVTDAGLAHLRDLTGLRDLDLSFTGSTGAGLRNLRGMTRLRKLELTQAAPISDDDLAHLGGLTALEWLQGAGPQITDAGLAHLGRLVNLKVFSIRSPRITSAGLGSLREMKRLERLTLSGGGVKDLAPVRHLTGLTSLGLGRCPIDDAGLAPVAGFTRLESLHLNETRVTDAGLDHLDGLKGLTHLNLDRTGIGDAGLAHVAGLRDLQNLWLDHTAVGDAGLVHLAGLNKVSLLFLEGTRVTDAGLAGLAGLRACKQVAVGSTAVTDEGIAAARLNRPGTRFVRMGF